MSETTALDVFAGVGWGVACGWLGVREYGVEIAPSAIRLRTASGMHTIYRDVWSGLCFPWIVPAHRLYIASPPCQTFSIAGGGEGRKALGDVLDAIDAGLYRDVDKLIALGERLDPRTALVLVPLAHIWQHRPELVALEQVPEALPVWHAYANVMRGLGYSVHVEVMRAEQFGVPQTRKRAILIARLDGKVVPPTPTHSRYYSTDPGRLDPGVEKWVSMAEALGGTPGSLMSTYSTNGDYENRGVRDGDHPSSTITSKADRSQWVVRKAMGAGMVERHGDRPGRTLDQPAFTIRGNAGGMEPGGFVFREELRDWEWLDAPATTIAADPRITAREHHEHSEQSGTSLRLTYLEAAALQSFPPDMVWPGNQGERFLAIGNAVPPLMAAAILGALLAPPAERDAWDNVFAEVAG
ncbi:DNA cytosine methyltransferase [Leucobacter luti]|uniref:DNA cytosine methyltransferase n=1 Tax=Leucobacter luti TaxID=340320 RepID=UPI001C690B11|nr:DNA cytosine methyltransferase [Leucobacter luti]QYM76912.1 DNA cytosine methyltransferase [Leucobacter luti]